MSSPISLYLHIPFCTHRCAYCDFNTYSGLEQLIPDYVEALIKEIKSLSRSSGGKLPLHTVFFGGGTPSLLPARSIKKVMDIVDEYHDLNEDAEITLEANPGKLDSKYLGDLRKAGVNRLSFGVQSSNSDELRILERQHEFLDVIQSVKKARQAGFDNLNLDLMFALPGQSLKNWRISVEHVVDLHPEHLSLYALSLEHGTPFKEMSDHGMLQVLDLDLAADMYGWAQTYLKANGFEQYEISNWATRDSKGDLLACTHNLQYWRNLPYIGCGAGAQGWIQGIRTLNTLSPAAYIKRLRERENDNFPRTAATIKAHNIDREMHMAETMMMGLRLVKAGVSLKDFAERFGQPLDSVYSAQLKELESNHLLERAGPQDDSLRLTPKAVLLGNQVFSEFV
jgi:oxygen-independent coproporphyrinogen-3 oxidase